MHKAVQSALDRLVAVHETEEREAEDKRSLDALSDLQRFERTPSTLRKKQALIEAAGVKVAKARAELSKASAEHAGHYLTWRDEDYQLEREHNRLRQAAVPWRQVNEAIRALDEDYERERRASGTGPRAVAVLMGGLRVLYEIRDTIREPFPSLDDYAHHVESVRVAYERVREEEQHGFATHRIAAEAEARKHRLLNPALS